jgi:hypothetical protein
MNDYLNRNSTFAVAALSALAPGALAVTPASPALAGGASRPAAILLTPPRAGGDTLTRMKVREMLLRPDAADLAPCRLPVRLPEQSPATAARPIDFDAGTPDRGGSEVISASRTEARPVAPIGAGVSRSPVSDLQELFATFPCGTSEVWGHLTPGGQGTPASGSAEGVNSAPRLPCPGSDTPISETCLRLPGSARQPAGARDCSAQRLEPKTGRVTPGRSRSRKPPCAAESGGAA